MNYHSIASVERVIYHPAFYGSIILLAVLSVFFTDAQVATYFHNQMSTGYYRFSEAITDLGYGKYYLITFSICILISQFILKNRLYTRVFFFLLLCIVIPGTLVNIIKFIFSRPRPIEYFENGIFALQYFHGNSRFSSFPSGHSSTIFGITMGLSYLYPRWIIPLMSIAVGIALTRIIVTAHYISDVLTGGLIAILCIPIIHYYLFRGLAKTEDNI